MSDIGSRLGDGAVETDGIVVLAPFLRFQAEVVKHQEPIGIEAFAAKLAANGRDENIILRFAP
nr:hypothetical protein [Gluconacetobacter asukensis]